ncbi:FAD/NAD-binding domain-containing protein [Trametopsis cervina]|nr:FAD/NAD-binding domain-containing protein [Trametopsis cervina]
MFSKLADWASGRKLSRSATESDSKREQGGPATPLEPGGPSGQSKAEPASNNGPAAELGAGGVDDSTYIAPEFNIDQFRRMKVICIGAGMSGILSAIRFRQRIPNLEFKIYEKQSGVGGTWWANRYPGVACDSPIHAYQYAFENYHRNQIRSLCLQTEWTQFYASGEEILANVERIVDKHKLRDYIHLEHELVRSEWDESRGQWTVRIRHGGAEFEETCDVLLLCVGSLCRWHWPDIEGLKDFRGTMMHTAQWDSEKGNLDTWGDKTVGVIGNGSSGIQVVSAIQPKVKSIINYARQKTWITADFAINELLTALGRAPGDTDAVFTEKEREYLRNPRNADEFKLTIAESMNVFIKLAMRDSELQKQTQLQFKAEVERRLAKKPELVNEFVPDFSVFCRRITPGAKYLEALCADNCTYETTHIKRITPSGIELKDGRHNDLDVLVLATGFDVSYQYPFPIIGRRQTKLNDRWTPYAEAYMSVAVDGFPNMFLPYGPASGTSTGSIITMVEQEVDYIVKCVAKLQRERIKAMEPKKTAMKNWAQHMRTVFTEDCRSWYKAADGTVMGQWPGSVIHAVKALEHPRWEDYDYELYDDTTNDLYWLGNGQTVDEHNKTGDRSYAQVQSYEVACSTSMTAGTDLNPRIRLVLGSSYVTSNPFHSWALPENSRSNTALIEGMMSLRIHRFCLIMFSPSAGWFWPFGRNRKTHADSVHTYTPPQFNIDDYRPMKKVPNLDFKIYEKQDGIGGTWFANQYPGVACDIPSHVYQYTFENETQWSKFYSPGQEIQANIERVVDKYKLRPYIHLKHELTHAKWDGSTSKWTVRIRRLREDGSTDEFEEPCDVLMLCIGGLNRWQWPNIDGLKAFKGTILHTAQWNQTDGAYENWGNKNVGVVGNGSSGLQAVSAIHPKVKTLINYGRQKTWIAPDLAIDEVRSRLHRQSGDPDITFTKEELEKFKDVKYAREFRHAVEHQMNTVHMTSIRDSDLQKRVRALVEEDMRNRLAKKPELQAKIIPSFSIFCRRLTPGDGYLEALCAENTTYETTPIKRITPTGIELVDGRHNDLDVLVLATGFDASYRYPFDIIGRGGNKLNDRWDPYPEAYMSVAVDGFPNMFLAFGPASGLNTGTLVAMLETQVEYAVQATLKMQRERLKSMEPKEEATKDWTQHMRAYFPKTVYTDDCNSWYKTRDGVVIGLWPGSILHAIKTLKHPRWEDFNYERLDDTPNRLYWIGDGQTVNELAWYLTDVDVPPVPEN